MSRLEEIIQYEHTTPKGRQYVGFKSEEDFKRLIAQAQKAEELQAKVEVLEEKPSVTAKLNLLNTIYKLRREVSSLKEENQRYKQALEFYANGINYQVFIENGKSNIEHDGGSKARQELKGVEDDS